MNRKNPYNYTSLSVRHEPVCDSIGPHILLVSAKCDSRWPLSAYISSVAFATHTMWYQSELIELRTGSEVK